MVTEEAILKKWNGWFDAAYNDVVTVHFYRKLYRDVGSMVNANPAIQKPNSFYAFLAQGYVTLVLVIIRRQATKRDDSFSLARLLSDISKHPALVSRERFHRFYAGKGFEEQQIDSDFESAGVEGGRASIDPASVLSDLAALAEATAPLKKYTDKTIAHIDKHKWTEAIPTFGDIDAAIDMLASICRKYSVLLRAEGIASFEPFIEPDWEDVFTVPWIANPTRGQSRRMTHVS